MYHNYSEKYNIIFIHIPKNAGSAIVKELGIEKSAHYPLSVLQKMMPKEVFDNAKKVAVIRNPWERMSSYYNYRQHHGQDPQNMPFTYWLRSGIVGINMPRYDSLSQYLWCLDEGEFRIWNSMDYILNYETLGQDWYELCKLENIPYNPLPIVNKVNTYNWKSHYVLQDDISLVGNYFRSDVKGFNYKYNEPNDINLMGGKEEMEKTLQNFLINRKLGDKR